MSYFTTYWSKERYEKMIASSMLGQTLDAMFGGPHISEPSLVRAGVQSGDIIYPVCVKSRDLYVLGSMRVKELISFDMFVHRNRSLFTGCHFDMGITEDNHGNIHWTVKHPQYAVLAPTCTDEAAIADTGHPLTPGIMVPPEMLVQMRYKSQRAERPIKQISNGKLISSVGIQGIYRLTEKSGMMIEKLLAF